MIVKKAQKSLGQLSKRLGQFIKRLGHYIETLGDTKVTITKKWLLKRLGKGAGNQVKGLDNSLKGSDI